MAALQYSFLLAGLQIAPGAVANALPAFWALHVEWYLVLLSAAGPSKPARSSFVARFLSPLKAMVALSSFVRFHAQRTPEQVAVIYGEERIGYAELMCRIETTAGWLAAHHIEPGDVVALLMKNSPAFLELTFATSHIGAVSLPINYRLTADEVGYIIDNAGARLLLCDEELAAAAIGLRHVMSVDAATQRNSRRLASPSQAGVRMHAAHPDDL